jgi:hypothetical protein
VRRHYGGEAHCAHAKRASRSAFKEKVQIATRNEAGDAIERCQTSNTDEFATHRSVDFYGCFRSTSAATVSRTSNDLGRITAAGICAIHCAPSNRLTPNDARDVVISARRRPV